MLRIVACLWSVLFGDQTQPGRLCAAVIPGLYVSLPTCVHDRRVGDLFNDKTVTGRLTSMAKKSIKGVENVYTQVNNLHREALLAYCEPTA